VRDSDLVKSAAFDVLLTDVYALRSTSKYFSVNRNADIYPMDVRLVPHFSRGCK